MPLISYYKKYDQLLSIILLAFSLSVSEASLQILKDDIEEIQDNFNDSSESCLQELLISCDLLETDSQTLASLNSGNDLSQALLWLKYNYVQYASRKCVAYKHLSIKARVLVDKWLENARKEDVDTELVIEHLLSSLMAREVDQTIGCVLEISMPNWQTIYNLAEFYLRSDKHKNEGYEIFRESVLRLVDTYEEDSEQCARSEYMDGIVSWMSGKNQHDIRDITEKLAGQREIDCSLRALEQLEEKYLPASVKNELKSLRTRIKAPQMRWHENNDSIERVTIEDFQKFEQLFLS